MPFEIMQDQNACPVGEPWAVKNAQTGELMGCHETEGDAQAQMTALNMGMMNENAASKPEVRHDVRELRSVSDFEARQQSDGSWKIGGYASTFNDPYEVHDRFGTFTETILPGAWDKTLNQRGHKIQLLASHDGLPYASTKSKSLRLSPDAHGLGWEARLSADSPRAQDLGVGIRDGYIDEMSVGMRVYDGGDSWSDDMAERQISEASLLEISVVARGANPNTEAGMREAELLAEIRALRTAMSLAEPAARAESVSLEADVDGLREMLNQRQPRLPITKELAALLERRK